MSAAASSSSSTSASASSASSIPPEFWLLKIPNFLHDQWEQAKKTNEAAATASSAASAKNVKAPTQQQLQLGQPIAHIWIERKPKDGTRKMKLVVPPAPSPTASSSPSMSSPSTAAPIEFTFSTKPRIAPQLVFGASVPPSQTQLAIAAQKTAANPNRPQPTPTAYKLDGEVALLADCTPKSGTTAYQQRLAERLQSHMVKQRTTKALEESRDATITPLTGMVPLKRKLNEFGGAARAAKVEKRVRMEPEQLERAVLELMSLPQFAYITLAKLSLELQQPLNAISDISKRLCIRQEDGINRGLYTLRPEYKLATDSDQQSMDLSSSNAPPPAAAVSYQIKTEIKREY